MNNLIIPVDFMCHNNIFLNRRKFTIKTKVKIMPLHPGWIRYKIVEADTTITICDCNGFGFKSIESAKRFLSAKRNKDKYELTAVETFSHSLF